MLPKPFPVNGFCEPKQAFPQDFSLLFRTSYTLDTVYSLWIKRAGNNLF